MATTHTTGNAPTTQAEQRTNRMLRELASDLADLVEAGDLTEAEANEWMVAKQDQWMGGDR